MPIDNCPVPAYPIRTMMMGAVLLAGAKIVYTYDVFWEESDIAWSSRWDAYLRMPGGRVHWFSILNSLMVVVVMSCIVAMIMMRTIRKDLAHYESLLVEPGAPPRTPCFSHGMCTAFWISTDAGCAACMKRPPRWWACANQCSGLHLAAGEWSGAGC